MELPLGIALLVMAVFLVIAVLLQSGKDNGLSGSIAGGSDTGGNDGRRHDPAGGICYLRGREGRKGQNNGWF